jgi:hypothetical protein
MGKLSIGKLSMGKLSQTCKYFRNVGFTTIALLGPLQLPPVHSIEFPPTDDVGAPSHSVGGGTRGSCNPTHSPIPLTPRNNVSTFVGETVELLVYIPELGTGAETPLGKLFVDDLETWEPIHEADLLITHTPGMLKISLPALTATGEPWVVDRYYQWELWLDCAGASIKAQGWLQRQEGNYNSLEAFNEAGIWQSVVTELEATRCLDPSGWEELLLGQLGPEFQPLVASTLADCQTPIP